MVLIIYMLDLTFIPIKYIPKRFEYDCIFLTQGYWKLKKKNDQLPSQAYIFLFFLVENRHIYSNQPVPN